MQAKDGGDQGGAFCPAGADKSAIFFNAGHCSFRAIPVAYLVAEISPDSGFTGCRSDLLQAAGYGIGAGMVIEQGGRSVSDVVNEGQKSAILYIFKRQGLV